MKVVVHRGTGGFSLDTDIIEVLKESGVNLEGGFEYDPMFRANEVLVACVEARQEWGMDTCDLVVLDIPDEATDWMIDEYDGAESVVYVVDGKLYEIDPDWDVFDEACGAEGQRGKTDGT